MISVKGNSADRNRFYIDIDGKIVEGIVCSDVYLNFDARAEDWPSAFDREELADLLPDIMAELYHGKKLLPIRRVRFFREICIPAQLKRVYEK